MSERMEFKVRRTRSGTWAVDRIHRLGGTFYTKDWTRYFPTEEKAEAFKKRRELEQK